MTLLDETFRLLRAIPLKPGSVTRAGIVAYATLAAWTQHWPSQATDEARSLLLRLRWIREAEPDRYIKQRRIAIARLAREIAGDR